MATRKIVPRADDEGGIGTALKRWASAFIAAITCTTINALTLAAASVGFTIAGGTTSQTLTVDETVALSEKAPRAQESWTDATLLNSWVAFDLANYVAPRYYKDAMGVVHVEGAVKDGVSPNHSIFTLPSGYRPTKSLFVGGISNNLWVDLRVAIGGDVSVGSGGSTIYVAFNFSFRVA